MTLKDEVALVTGGSRGIGAATVKALAAAGAEVFVNYVRSAKSAEDVCAQVKEAGGNATPIQFDVSDPASIKSALDGLSKQGKQISILVNNSGIAKDGLSMRYSVEDWDAVLNTNLRGAFLVTQAVMRSMMKAKRGNIINISSVVGITGNPGQAAYCASKAGIIGLTKSLAKELASRNIRVNAVAPGFIETEMTGELTDAQREAILGQIPMGRIAKTEEIAHAVRFLASPAANYITGQTIVVDGGMTM